MLNELLALYGLPTLVCGCIVMVLIGLLKIATKKTGNERIVQFYPLFAIIASMICCGGYLFIFNKPFELVSYLTMVSAVYACSQALYPLYENYGGRKLFLALLALIIEQDDTDD